MTDVEMLCKTAKQAVKSIAILSEKDINIALLSCAEALKSNAEFLKTENEKDVKEAIKNGKEPSFIDRLTLTDKIIESMADGIIEVSKLKSPLDKTVYRYENKEQGIKIAKKTVPFGLIAIIYEARPNVTADAFSLCFKTKNAVILKGGKEAINSNKAIVKVLKSALKNCNIDDGAVSLIEDTSRETTLSLMKMNKYVDLIIPRGSASLIKTAVENSTVPIIETGTGNCHVYVDEFADIEKAADIIYNAKTQRYGVCNACESLVIHKKILDKALPVIAERLKEKQVEIRADESAMKVINDYPYLKKATEEDFYTEYLDAIISVKTVDNIKEAIDHINVHSTHHSEAIVTENLSRAKKFLKEIDSACVYHNASTRFSDGFVFGLGAEIGISTQKMHARGPMGLSALVTTKYIVKGNGSVRK